MGAYIPSVAGQQGPANYGVPRPKPVNGFADQPQQPFNGFAQAPAPMPRPKPMPPSGPMPGGAPGGMPGGMQGPVNPMTAPMQQRGGGGQPSMMDRLMSPQAQIGFSLMANSGPSLTPVNAFAGIAPAVNNAAIYQRQKEKDAQAAAERQALQQREAAQRQAVTRLGIDTNLPEALQAAQFKAMQPEQATALQRDYEFLKRQGYSDQESIAILKKGTTIDVSQGADVPTLREQLSKNEANEWGKYLDGANNSRAILNNVEVLDQLVEVAPQGPITGRLAQAFPGFSTAGDAFQSQISQMLPYFRAPGSGAQSDKDMEVLERGLASLVGAPETNRLILGTVRQKAQLDMQRAEIIRMYQNGDIETPAEARRMLSELNNTSVLDPEMRRLLMGVGAFSTEDSISQDTNAAALKSAEAALREGRDPDIIREMLDNSGIKTPEGFFNGY